MVDNLPYALQTFQPGSITAEITLGKISIFQQFKSPNLWSQFPLKSWNSAHKGIPPGWELLCYSDLLKMILCRPVLHGCVQHLHFGPSNAEENCLKRVLLIICTDELVCKYFDLSTFVFCYRETLRVTF